ncbi:excalibur calcium-binding domain-containing protein [Bacillus sp. JJ1533]|uniref:excalibur calcium-binding domain-containing protein n=1 Tax=Bacillus sp. JJ1533 TaxID=3122959 RepID=UPI003F68AA86
MATLEAEAVAVAASSEGSEDFSNYTELRKKYPNGVASNHIAYHPKMVRDKDNFACEK